MLAHYQRFSCFHNFANVQIFCFNLPSLRCSTMQNTTSNSGFKIACHYKCQTRHASIVAEPLVRLNLTRGTNFGTCAANSICSCPDGWGFQDCSKPLCGSLAQLNSSRPIVTDGTACQCTNDFDGPNCNVCQSDGACAFLPQSTIGTANVCNKSPVAWSDKHFTFCGVKNTLLSAAYSGVPKVTLNRNSISESVFATLWIQDVPQFSCTANSCSQTFNSST